MLGDDELLHDDLVQTSALDQLALAVFPIDSRSREPLLPAARASTAAIRRAQQHADGPTTVTDIARAAGFSVRALHDGFRRDFETTPRAYLETVRLSAVRAERTAAVDDDVPVAEVARRWGFLHLGRFAARYRAACGENLGRTLQRSGRTAPAS